MGRPHSDLSSGRCAGLSLPSALTSDVPRDAYTAPFRKLLETQSVSGALLRHKEPTVAQGPGQRHPRLARVFTRQMRLCNESLRGPSVSGSLAWRGSPRSAARTSGRAGGGSLPCDRHPCRGQMRPETRSECRRSWRPHARPRDVHPAGSPSLATEICYEALPPHNGAEGTVWSPPTPCPLCG